MKITDFKPGTKIRRTTWSKDAYIRVYNTVNPEDEHGVSYILNYSEAFADNWVKYEDKKQEWLNGISVKITVYDPYFDKHVNIGNIDAIKQILSDTWDKAMESVKCKS